MRKSHLVLIIVVTLLVVGYVGYILGKGTGIRQAAENIGKRLNQSEARVAEECGACKSAGYNVLDIGGKYSGCWSSDGLTLKAVCYY